MARTTLCRPCAGARLDVGCNLVPATLCRTTLCQVTLCRVLWSKPSWHKVRPNRGRPYCYAPGPHTNKRTQNTNTPSCFKLQFAQHTAFCYNVLLQTKDVASQLTDPGCPTVGHSKTPIWHADTRTITSSSSLRIRWVLLQMQRVSLRFGSSGLLKGFKGGP